MEEQKKTKIYQISGLSSHADLQGLINWVKNIKNGVSKEIYITQIYITHGEAEACENF
jgi:metallo-beta-lactamase family protein